ncbi:unnamed protein product [Agarophyton chilense]
MDRTRVVTNALLQLDRFVEKLNWFLRTLYTVLTLSLLFSASLVYLKYLLPLVFKSLPLLVAALHTVFSFYLLFSVLSNYVLCLRTCAGVVQLHADVEANAHSSHPQSNPNTAVIRSELWRFCTVCQTYKPPRAHHCSLCNVCFFRLCHHCPALGKCIGQNNYPFFFRLIYSASVGSAFAALTCAYLYSTTHDSNTLFFTAVAACSMSISLTFLFCWNLFLLATGQTTVEWLENIALRRRGPAPPEWGRFSGPFNRGFRRNVQEAFGSFSSRLVPWWFILLLPVPRREGPHSLEKGTG